MADVRLTEIPAIALVQTGSLAYVVDSSQSYRGTIDQIASRIINSYNIFASPLAGSLMTVTNAEVLLAGLNNATLSQLDSSRVDLTDVYDTISDLSFDIDGGTFFDTYINSTTFDGGTI